MKGIEPWNTAYNVLMLTVEPLAIIIIILLYYYYYIIIIIEEKHHFNHKTKELRKNRFQKSLQILQN